MEQENRERIIKLELLAGFERQRIDYRLDHHEARLTKLETAPTVTERIERAVGAGTLLKLLLAVAVTIVAFLATGDPHTFVKAFKSGAGL